MKATLMCSIVVLISACAAMPNGPASGPAVADPHAALLSAHAQTAQIMARGDGPGSDSTYDDDALLVLTNGKVHRGKAAIRPVIEGAPALQFRDAKFEDVQAAILKNGAYVRARFSFAMTLPNGKIISPTGRRLTLWRPKADGGWVLKADVWVPDRPAPKPDVADTIARQIESLEAAYNAHDPRGAQALFAPAALFALSDATVFEGPGVQGMLDFAFKAGLRDMRLENLTMVDAGSAVIVGSDFGLHIGNASVPAKKIEGCRLDVWTEDTGRWRLLAELAQPAGSASCLN